MQRKKRLIGVRILFLVMLMLLSVIGNSSAMQVQAASKLKLTKASEEYAIGESKQIKIKGLPKDAKITYQSSQKKIATVSKTGKVTAIKKGTAKITVIIKKGKSQTKLTYKAVVKAPTANKKSISLKTGEKAKIGVKYTPAKSAKLKFQWTSNKKSIATVKAGKVEGKKPGTATITCKVLSGKKVLYKFSVQVKVSKKQAKTYQVVFKSNGGSKVKAQTVSSGQKIKKPKNPKKNGYLFGGWYSDKALKKPYKFSSKVKGKKTLYAKWISKDLGVLACNITGAQVGVEEEALFTLAIKKDTKKLVYLFKGKTSVGVMHDDGKNGDITANDGIYTLKVICKQSAEKKEDYQALSSEMNSNVVTLRYFDEIGQEDLKEQFSCVNEIKEIQKKFETNGYVEESKIETTIEAVYQQAKAWEKDGKVLSVEKEENGVTMQFASGIWYYYQPSIEGKDAVGSDVNVSITSIQPFNTWYKENRAEETAIVDTVATDGAASRIAEKFENYSFEGNYDDKDVSLEVINSFSSNQVILWHGHGGYIKSKGPIICVGEEFNEVKFLLNPIYYLKNMKYTSDYLSGRIIATGYNQIAITGAYIDKYVGDMSNSFVYLGACESGKDNVLAQSFLDKGASAVVGNTESINSIYNCKMMIDVANGLMTTTSDIGNYHTLSEAIKYAQEINGVDDGSKEKAHPIVFGDKEYRLADAKSGMLNGIVRSAKDNTALYDVTVELYNQEDVKVGSVVTDNKGCYEFDVPAGMYQVRIEATGYKYFTDNVKIMSAQTTYVENILLVNDTTNNGVISGTVYDAQTGNAVEGVNLSFREGWNVDDGEIIKSVSTNSNGMYELVIPAGYYTIQLEKENYSTSTINVSVQDDVITKYDPVISTLDITDLYRIVLTWQKDPRDLDAHIVGKTPKETPFHIYFRNQVCREDDDLVVELDRDDTDSYGPETVTLKPTQGKRYFYYVHHYKGDGDLVTSDAQVKVYKGSQQVAVFNVPTSGEGRYWNLFTLVNGRIELVNTISSSPMAE